MIIDWINSGIA